MVYGGAYIFFALCCGLGAAWIARGKGQPAWLWFIIALVLPVVGNAAVALSRNEFDEPRRQCPTCKQVLKAYDAKCMRCGTELSYPTDEELLPSVNRVRMLRAEGKL